jgi:hypothetical protein
MAIYRLMHDASFDDAETKLLAASYEAALQLLGLKNREDPITKIVASKIIEVFRAGQRDPARICAETLKALGTPLTNDQVAG